MHQNIYRVLTLLFSAALLAPLAATVPVANPAQAQLVQLGLFTLDWSSTESELTTRVAWGDLDDDGDLDMAVANYDAPSRVYRNEGGQFTPIWQTLAERSTSVAWGDYDGDGDQDLAVGNGMTLRSNDSGQQNRIYRNVAGVLETTAIWSSPEAERTVAVAWGDADNDGDLDLVAANGGVRRVDCANTAGEPLWVRLLCQNNTTGDPIYLPSAGADRLYINDGVSAAGAPLLRSTQLPGIDDASGDIAWGDYDGDGLLDLAVANLGLDAIVDTIFGPQRITAGDYDRVYRNVTPPGGDPQFSLAWESPFLDPSFSVAWGDVDQAVDVTGQRHLDLVFANASTPYNGTLYDFPMRSYAYAGGSFAHDALWTPPSLATLGVALGDYDSDGDLDLATANAAPLNSDTVGEPNHIYENVGGRFANTPAWESPEFDDSFSVSWADIDNDGDLDLLAGNGGVLISHAFPGQPNRLYVNTSGVLAADPGAVPAAAGEATGAAWGDYDNDHDLDLVVARRNGPAQLFRNTNGSFGEPPTLLGTGSPFAAVAWGDYNADGWLDLVVSNYGGSEQIYRNTGGSFSLAAELGPGSWSTSVAWADYDSDGDLDLAVGNEGEPSQLYQNQSGTFAAVAVLPSIGVADTTLSLAWGDYDGDGDLDLAVGNYGQPNKLYRNQNGTLDGTPIWQAAATDLTTSLAWGDYDGDGDLDLAVGNSGQPKRLYRNDNGALNTSASWLSIESDVSTSVAWADYDGDGDLDLAVGNGGFSARGGCSDADRAVTQVNRVYRNTGSGLESRASWVSSDQEYTTAVAWGDYDSDGDLDLFAANCSAGRSAIYTNRRADAASPLAEQPVVTLAFPTGTAEANFHANPALLSDQTIPVSFTLRHPASQPVRFVRLSYSPDGGGKWLPARSSSGSDRLVDLATSPAGVSHVFAWDTYASNFFGESDAVLLRIEAYASVRPADAATAPLQYAAATATTFPFRVRGTQVQVLDTAGAGVEGALVYRLPAGRARGALPMTRGAGSPAFVTDGRGFLQGRGELLARPAGASSGGDQLLAMRPVLMTETYTLYHTSGPISANSGLQLAPVEQPGVQQLTVGAENPLLLFRLEVALEWDARGDTRYMAQLERDLQRASEILYDYSDGQAAIGEIMLYHDARRERYDGWDLWAFSQVRIYATNRLRPNANKGGSVITPTLDPANDAIVYEPGQVRMGALWNRYGDRSGELGEDWPRTLAHELSHYLLFLDDNYLGLQNGVLVGIDSCQGAMSDPYRDEYSEFHPHGAAWDANCGATLSEQSTGRADWETIQAFYPPAIFGLEAPTSYNANPGPDLLPLALTQISTAVPDQPQPAAPGELPPPPPAPPLEVPIFTIEGQVGQGARAFVFQGDWLTDLGRPAGTRLETRGAALGDRLCVYDLPGGALGCETLRPGDQTLSMAGVANWQPEISVTPITSRTLVLNVQLGAGSAPLTEGLVARLYPLDYPAGAALPLVEVGDLYSATLQLDEPIFEGYIHVSAGDGREAVIDFTIGGNPGRLWSRRVPPGSPGRLWSRRAPRSNPGRLWSRRAPVISGDGQVTVFTADETIAEGEFYALQSVAQAPQTPPWAVPVGQAYRLTATSNAPDLTRASISMGYLSAEVPDGAERWLRLYRFNEPAAQPLSDTMALGSWQPLSSTINLEFNMVSAAIPGPGIYAIMASVELPSFTEAGWNSFSYPLATSRGVATSLASIAGSYTMVYHKRGGAMGERWQLYATDVPGYVNDLETLEFARSYEIFVTRAVTISLRPDLLGTLRQAAQIEQRTAPVPATFYGTLVASPGFAPAVGSSVEAFIGGTLCGQGRTLANEGAIVYVIKVEAACGVGQSVAFRVGGQAMASEGRWDNRLVQELDLRANGNRQLFLPLVR